VKVYINNRNYFTWPRRQAEWFAGQGHEVVIIDNDSDYPPLVDWYDACEYTVVRLHANFGHEAPWRASVVDSSDYYAVTDPDLSFEGIPDDWPEVCIEGIRRGAMKCGFSLDETKVPSSNPAWILDEFHLYPEGDHPARWADKLKDGIYLDYSIDTTFAVYAPGGRHGIGGRRIDRPYTARHLPWHIVAERLKDEDSFQIPMDEEIYYYFSTASNSSVTRGRLQTILSDYKGRREMVEIVEG
jgi:hypothetical protein